MYAGPDYTTSITNLDWRGWYARHEGETHEQHAERLIAEVWEERMRVSEWRAKAEERRAALACTSWTCVVLGLTLLAILLEGR